MTVNSRLARALTTLSVAALPLLALSPTAGASPRRTPAKPTVVLVHGAWADAAGWTPVVKRLQAAGYTVVAPPNPLRGLASDSRYISSVLDHISGPVILAGHSYGGAVITDAAVGHANVKSLVYIAGWGPDAGDSLLTLGQRKIAHPIPQLPLKQTSFPKPDGSAGAELTINPAKYSSVFLDNALPRAEARAMAAEQRPLSVDAVNQPSGTPAWKTIPSWYMVAKHDRAIAPDLERFMAARMHAHTVEENGPHLIMVTKPGPVTQLIERAARATAG